MAYDWSNIPHATSSPTRRVPGPNRGMLAWLRDRVGGWLGPRESRDTDRGDYLQSEKAAQGPRGIADLPWFLPHITEQTGETNEIRLAYRRMWAAPDVKAAVLSKIFAVGALDLKFVPASKKNEAHKRDADFADYVFNQHFAGGVANLVWTILSGGLPDGYSLSEKVVRPIDRGKWSGQWGLRDLRAIDVGNDAIIQTDEY